MRSLWLTGTVAALLGGCASVESGQTVAVKADEAPASHDHSPASDTPLHPHTQVDSIPAAYRGVYDISLEACGRPSDGRLTVSARELRFHESIGSVRSVAYGGTGAIAVEADYQGEGERWRGLRILSLTENGAKLTLKGEGTSLNRVRCPEGVR
jgi:uncharacterized protein YceK